MRMPALTRRMVLEAPVRTADGAGGFDITWQPVGTLWAGVKPGSGREIAAEGATVSRVPCKIFVRAAPYGQSLRPEPDQRLREGARIYIILAVTGDDPSGMYLTCHAIEEVVV